MRLPKERGVEAGGGRALALQVCQLLVLRDDDVLHREFARLVMNVLCLDELLPPKASRACTVLLLTYLTDPDISCFEGKMLLICIGLVPTL